MMTAVTVESIRDAENVVKIVALEAEGGGIRKRLAHRERGTY